MGSADVNLFSTFRLAKSPLFVARCGFDEPGFPAPDPLLLLVSATVGERRCWATALS